MENADLEKFAVLYGQLAGRKLELGPGVPLLNLDLRSQTELTAGEALHALDLLLGLHGFKVTRQQDSATLKMIAETQRSK